MIEINNTDELEKYKDYKSKVLVFDDKEGVHIRNFDLLLESGWSIKSEGCIESGGHIESRGSIESGGPIKSGWYIESGGPIKSGWYIESGGYIKSEGYVLSLSFDIKADRIKTCILPFWREYWVDMFPLRKWESAIRSDKCWDDLKNLPTHEEKLKICAWEGWHWLLRGHLECFFGLREYFEPPKSNEK